MKKTYIAVLISAFTMFIAVLAPVVAHAANPIAVTISGENVYFTDQTPVIVDGRVLVPLRDVFETLGFNVDWEEATQTITLQNAEYTVIVEIDNDVFTTNGEEFPLDVPAQIVDGRTMLPIRSILESVDFNVDWDADTNTVVTTTDIRLDIVPVPIATAGHSSFAIRDDGSLWAWGCNRFGRLGDGTITLTNWLEIISDNDRAAPVRIMDNVAAVFADVTHTMAITNDGVLWAWGENSRGQLGDGTTISRLRPIRIMDNVVYVSLSGSTTMAVRADGSLWGWGTSHYNFTYGTFVTIPQPVRIMENVVSVSIGTDHAMVVRGDGSLLTWGKNHSGQLGNGASTYFHDYEVDGYTATVLVTHGDFARVRIADRVISATATVNRSMAVTRGGELYVWGWDNGSHIGTFGDSTMYFTEPTYILSSVRHATQNRSFIARTYIIMDDGALIANGPLMNRWGEHLRHFWLQEILNDVVFVSADWDHTLAITRDGSLWAWGCNENGQLGNRTNSPSIEPVRIMSNMMRP